MRSHLPGLLAAIACALALFGAPAAHGQAAAPVGAFALELHPTSIALEHARDATRVVISARFEDGTTRDVTREAELHVEPRGIARVRADRWVEPLRDGAARLVASWQGRSVEMPLAVSNAELDPALSFERDVLATLTKTGCNAGGCHGSAAGKNGFRLSLFAFDPRKDHERLTRELLARRIDFARPEQSLLLAKPSGGAPHQGGVLFSALSPHYATLLRWIREGARDDAPPPPPLTALEILPRELVLDGAEREHALLVRAVYADGSDRDVTSLALLSSSNDAIARLEGDATVISGQRGSTYLMARFGTLATTARVLVLPSGAPPAAEPSASSNAIDREIQSTLQRLRWQSAPRCSDETFVRRIHLDLVNLLPTPEEVRAFVADADPEKRAKLIDRLLAREEFSRVWAMAWADVFRLESRALEEKGVHLAVRWLTDAIHAGRPFDEIARELLTASGSHFEVPAASYWVAEQDVKAVAENTAQALLGIRLQCAQCHNHPFDRWTMDDYYGFASFFAQVGRKPGFDPRERVVFDARSGGVRHARDGRDVPPRVLGGAAPADVQGQDRRAVLAAWLASAENPWFARHVANRLWERFFGRGLVEPVDDVRISNPPSHPALLEVLAQHLRENRFDLRATARFIASSETYQRDVPIDAAPPEAFAGAAVRRLGAEALLDAIDRVTGVPSEHAGVGSGGRALDLPLAEARHPFLALFGRPARSSACTCERRSEPTLGQALHLVNGTTIAEKIAHPQGRLHRSLAAGKPQAELLEELWLAAYARRPTPSEVARVGAELAGAPDPKAAWEDLLWALLNSREFLFQH
ncbi:MAG: DUF1549 domain-containing protein [Planctomycetes bacterium]|nr:DUF1549 domain-containing protein [Planctomycetota bacterium]